jgi:predicted dehydrogenase
VTAAGRLRIGTLGAARITPNALIRPARQVPEAQVVAIAARDHMRADKFARKHGIPNVHATYNDVIADPDVDAIYNPLPNSLHAEWTLKAIAAGKHVLCEKPFTSNAAEAETVRDAADGTGLVVMEAFHYRYHPLAQRMHDIVAGGELGTLHYVETWMCIPLPRFSDIRYQYDLAGGATMDVGSYTVHQLRLLGGDEPEVTGTVTRLRSPNVDRWMQADVRWPAGHTGHMTCALWSSTLLKLAIRARGNRGELRVFNPTGPQFYHRFTVVTDGKKRHERFPRKPTYTYQLEAFTSAALHGTPVLTPPADSVQNMRVIDAVYRAAGLPLRGEGVRGAPGS